MDKVEISGWERSKISNQDQKSLKKLGLMKKKDSLIFPGHESFSSPPIGYQVTFIDHLIRVLSTPIHEFLRGLLFVYGIQLHQLTPNSILYISIFITLCECFLGTHPHWGLWKRIFYLRRNNSHNIVYNVGGVCICVRPDVDYFDVKFPDSIQGWRRRCLYIREEYVNNQEYGIVPFDVALQEAEERAEALAAKLELSEKARKKTEADAATVEDLRQRLSNAENALSDKIAQQIKREQGIIDRFDCQNRRFVRRMGKELKLHEAEEDRLLDTLAILELQGDLARTNISDARAAFTRLFPHFFPKQPQPQIFSELSSASFPRKTLLWPIDKTI
ncbi:hypothetical protein QYE76_006336 [Lolium multiflorum]|uniref:Transposase (putative) gypsy type domain-containing protein n=1 Tax=Lolium multiflorum TaxID=4521 RepID=A0AAD8RY13_LOLMU|nr:hypothetical protein QYE76_006336 [Lolium multiflorum]